MLFCPLYKYQDAVMVMEEEEKKKKKSDLALACANKQTSGAHKKCTQIGI